MRRALGTLTIALWLALAGVVVSAAPASAHPGVTVCTPGQRNVGGAVPVQVCTCLQSLLERRNVGGTGPAAPACSCLQSLLERRNVGGTGPADGTCPPWLNFGWQFPRFR